MCSDIEVVLLLFLITEGEQLGSIMNTLEIAATVSLCMVAVFKSSVRSITESVVTACNQNASLSV